MQITINLPNPNEKKRPARSTLVVRLLKSYGIPGKRASYYFTQYSYEYILRKCWLIDYYIGLEKPMRNKTAWLTSAIERDYSEPEAFHDWMKKKREQILNGNNEELKELV